VSLSQDPIIELLNQHFICGWRNINGVEAYAGRSHGHPVCSTATHTSNGAGGRNVQIMIISPERDVLHVLPGYWNPDALRHELEFSLELAKICRQDLPRSEKSDAFLLAHLNHAALHSGLMTRDSELQGFDAMREESIEKSDFKKRGGEGNAERTVDQVMHERMARRPLLKVDEFDLANVIHYGAKFYDHADDGWCPTDHNGSKLVRVPIPVGSGERGPWRVTSDVGETPDTP